MSLHFAIEILQTELKSRKTIFDNFLDKNEVNKKDYESKNESLRKAIKILCKELNNE